MKKTLLILFALPFLLSAQNVTVNTVKKSSFVKQMIKGKQAEKSVFVYSGAGNNLPDSIYTYNTEGKRLINKAAITYDDKERKLQERGLTEYNQAGIPQTEYKYDYVYKTEGDNYIIEEIRSEFEEEGWSYVFKVVSIYESGNMILPVKYYTLAYNGSEWEPDMSTVATEFDAENRPVVFMDSALYLDNDTIVMRLEISYNEQGLYDLVTTFEQGDVKSLNAEQAWLPVEKIVLSYNANKKFLKDVHYDHKYNSETEQLGWIYSYEIDYEYDEKGNLSIEIERVEDRVVLAYNFVNIYLSGNGNSNDVIFVVKSKIYPNPASDVLFVSVEDADDVVLTLVNAAGSVVAQKAASGSVTGISVQSFAKGNYFLIVKTDRGTKTHKVIIK